MAVKASFLTDSEFNNAKGHLFQLAFTGNYGVQGTGDTLVLLPVSSANPTGVTDPTNSYDQQLADEAIVIGVFSENLGGYYVQVDPNVNAPLSGVGVRVFAPDGAELNTNEAYPAAVLNGTVVIEAKQGLQ